MLSGAFFAKRSISTTWGRFFALEERQRLRMIYREHKAVKK
jgi:hypothetical protein